jgi:hypothetical protein
MRTAFELDEKDIRTALAYWIKSGAPEPAGAFDVTISVTPGDKSGDPRESPFPTIKATVRQK